MYLQTEFCLSDFARKNGYSLLELLQFLNLVLTNMKPWLNKSGKIKSIAKIEYCCTPK